jgi:hypothetical protein
MSLPAPRDAPARSQVHTGLFWRLSPHRVGPRGGHGSAWPYRQRPVATQPSMTRPSPQSSRNGLLMGRWAGMPRPCGPSYSREAPRYQRAPWRRNQHRGHTGGDGVGQAGYTPRTGDQGLAITDHHGSVVAPAPVAPVHETGIILWPQGLKALKQVAKQVGVDLRGTSLLPSMCCGCGSGLGTGGRRPAVVAPCRTPPAAALWDEVAGVDDDQPASVLRCLTPATSAWPRHAVTPQRTTARRAVLATRDPCRTAAVHTPG